MRQKIRNAPTNSPLEGTIYAWAKALAVDRKTIERGLVATDIKPEPLTKFTAKQIFSAMNGGDLMFEKTRRERAEADKAEIETALLKKSVITTEVATMCIRDTFAPIREWLIAMPGQYAARCNPANPAMAKLALIEAVDACLKQNKEHLPEESK